MKALEHAAFQQMAGRVSALYNDAEDALLLGMLGQEYVVRHNGVFLLGQKAPESHAAIVLDYLFSPGKELVLLPWRSFGDFAGKPVPEFRRQVEAPLAQSAAAFIQRAGAILPLVDGAADRSIIASDLAITVRALPKVYLHIELSRDANDFPPEVWVQFSRNADEFLSLTGMQGLAELFRERVQSLLRTY